MKKWRVSVLFLGCWWRRSLGWSSATSTWASSAATMYALNDLALLEHIPRHSADTSRSKVGILGLNAAQTAHLFISRLIHVVIFANTIRNKKVSKHAVNNKNNRLTYAIEKQKPIWQCHPYLLPLCNQVSVGVSLLQQIFVQFLGDGLALVEKFIYISRSLVVDPEDGPQCLNLSLALMWIVLS